MFSGCLSVSAPVRPDVLSVSTISWHPVDGISPNFGDDVVDGTDELIRL